MEAKRRPFEEFADRSAVRPGVETNGHSTMVYLGGVPPDFRGHAVTGGFMVKSEVKSIARQRYGIKKLAYWTDPCVRRRSLEEIRDATEERFIYATRAALDHLYLEYSEAFDAEKAGLVYVRSIIDLGQRVIAPRWQGRFFTRPVIKRQAELDELSEYSLSVSGLFGGMAENGSSDQSTIVAESGSQSWRSNQAQVSDSQWLLDGLDFEGEEVSVWNFDGIPENGG
jgi:hypothetical protein